jgi:hypothetical protein
MRYVENMFDFGCVDQLGGEVLTVAGISMVAQCRCDARFPTVRQVVLLVPIAISLSSLQRHLLMLIIFPLPYYDELYRSIAPLRQSLPRTGRLGIPNQISSDPATHHHDTSPNLQP